MTEQVNTHLVKKITPKTVCGNVRTVLNANIAEGKPLDETGKSMLLYTVFGRVTGVRVIPAKDEFQESYALQGVHEAKNATNGDIYKGREAFLPEPMSGMLVERIGQDGVESVDYALEVSIRRDDDSSVGYVYESVTKLDAAESDPLSDLRNAALPGNSAPKLAAPKAKASK